MADPKVGPADPDTVHRLLQERQASDAKGDKTYQRPTSPSVRESYTTGPVVSGKAREAAIESIVDATQRHNASRE